MQGQTDAISNKQSGMLAWVPVWVLVLDVAVALTQRSESKLQTVRSNLQGRRRRGHLQRVVQHSPALHL